MRAPGNARVLRDALRALDVSVTQLTDHAELEGRLTQDPGPELVLLDVDGYGAQAGQMGRSLDDASVPYVVLSHPRTAPQASRLLACGARAVLTKPVEKKVLLDLLGSVRSSRLDYELAATHGLERTGR